MMTGSCSTSLLPSLSISKEARGPLAPADVREDGLMTMWSLWAATEREPHTLQVPYHRLSRPEKERNPAVAEAAVS
jgi:glutathione S-transferase